MLYKHVDKSRCVPKKLSQDKHVRVLCEAGKKITEEGVGVTKGTFKRISVWIHNCFVQEANLDQQADETTQQYEDRIQKTAPCDPNDPSVGNKWFPREANETGEEYLLRVRNLSDVRPCRIRLTPIHRLLLENSQLVPEQYRSRFRAVFFRERTAHNHCMAPKDRLPCRCLCGPKGRTAIR